jgi:hypothetical protein
METARHLHTATLLSDGKVLVAGGSSVNGLTASVELYNPTTGLWSATGSMITPRSHHAAALLSTSIGKDEVLVVGGLSDYFNEVYTELAEVYDHKKGSWSATGSMSTPRLYFTLTRLNDGRVLAAGGFGTVEVPMPAITELYAPK